MLVILIFVPTGTGKGIPFIWVQIKLHCCLSRKMYEGTAFHSKCCVHCNTEFLPNAFFLLCETHYSEFSYDLLTGTAVRVAYI